MRQIEGHNQNQKAKMNKLASAIICDNKVEKLRFSSLTVPFDFYRRLLLCCTQVPRRLRTRQFLLPLVCLIREEKNEIL